MLPTVVESVFNAARTGNLAALKVSPCPTLGMLLFRVFFSVFFVLLRYKHSLYDTSLHERIV